MNNQGMAKEDIYYKKVKKHLTEFCETTLPEAIALQTENKAAPFLKWFTGTYNEILKIKKDDESRHKKIIDVLKERLPDLESAVNSLKEDKKESWVDRILHATEKLPRIVDEEQSTDRFTVFESDPFRIKIGKKIKQTVYKRFGKNSETQKIPLQNIVKLEILNSLYITDELNSEQYILITSALDLILELENSNPDEQSVEKDSKYKDEFRIEPVLYIENHLQQGIQLLKKGVDVSKLKLNKLHEGSLKKAIKADTIEINAELFSDKVIEKQKKRVGEGAKQIGGNWYDYAHSQFADFCIQLEIATFGWAASEVQKNILEVTHKFFRDFFYIPLEDGIAYIKNIKENIKESSRVDSVSEKKSEKIREKLEKDLETEFLPKISDTELQREAISQIEEMLSSLQIQTSGFTETMNLASERKIENNKALVDFDTIAWRSLASRFFKENALRELDPTEKHLNNLSEKISGNFEEAFRIADVNVMAALESKKSEEAEESSLEIATGGLTRSIKLLEETIREARKYQNEYEDIVHTKLPATLHELSQFMLSRSYDEFEFRDKALQVKQKAQNWQGRLRLFWDIIVEKIELFWRFSAKKTVGVRSVIAKYLGFQTEKKVSSRVKRNLAEYLAMSAIDRPLPFVYKNLFDNKTKVDSRFYVDPGQVDTTIKASYEEWKRTQKTNANLLIVGEKGSGKSSAYTNFISQRQIEEKIVKITAKDTLFKETDLLKLLCDALAFKSVNNREEFIEKVKRRKNRSVVVFENLQNIFVRSIHGFEALDSFWVIMSATRQHLFWMVTCSRYGWDFVKKTSGAEQFYSHIVDVDTLTREKITKAIMLRHKATGYDLFFEGDNNILRTRAYRKWQADQDKSQEYLKNLFFERLSKIAEGNISIAIIFWIQAIKKIEENTFYMSPIEVADVDKLEAPSRDVLFTLASLVIHDRLNTEEMAMSLHQEERESRLMLIRLQSNGIVIEDEGGFGLNHLVFRQVIRLLKQRNIIH